jgi:hypothetical protein
MSRQHVVFYFLAELSPEYGADFSWANIKPEVDETDCVVWLPLADVPNLIACSTPEKTIEALKVTKCGCFNCTN